METKIVLLKVVREMKKAEQGDPAYQARILKMDKLALLEEMMNFQEERSRLGHLTLTMMVQGQILFRALELAAETEELKELAGSYCRHLKYELQEHLKKLPAAQDG